jgi:hypothetical protein
MLKTCDDCQAEFDIFKEGYGYQFFVVCGKCWTTENKRRELGGVFTRGGK